MRDLRRLRLERNLTSEKQRIFIFDRLTILIFSNRDTYKNKVLIILITYISIDLQYIYNIILTILLFYIFDLSVYTE